MTAEKLKHQDKILKSLTKDGQAVVIAVDARDVLQEALDRVEAWPPAMIHLGQAMLSAALLQSLPDHAADTRLELQWRCDGPFGPLFAECRDRGRLRGTVLYPKPDVIDLKHSMGVGHLQVRRSRSGASTGIVAAQGNVVLDVLEYLEKSEQKNCAMSLWVDLSVDSPADSLLNESASSSKKSDHPAQPFKVRHAFGYLVHVLPQKTKQIENAMLYNWDRHLKSLGPISNWVFRENPCAEILSFVSAEFSPNIIESENLDFFCSCSEERAERALAISNQAENEVANEALKTNLLQNTEEVQCEFCGKIYLLKNNKENS